MSTESISSASEAAEGEGKKELKPAQIKKPLSHEQLAAAIKRREERAAKQEERLAKIASGESGLGKVRQHVNPLAPAFQDPIPTPDWAAVFGNPTQDLHLDLGCGKGHFMMELSRLEPHRNHIGVEIREPLVVRADRWVREEGLRNCHFLYGNINVSVESLLRGYPGKVELVTVMMPDPWFKKRHHKRRLLQPQLVSQFAERMQPGARFFVMSDVKEAAESMVEVMNESPDFSDWTGEWEERTLPCATERETSCLGRGESIYRAMFYRR